MGKKRDKKFCPAKSGPLGHRVVNGGGDSPAATSRTLQEIVKQLQDADEAVRGCGCSTLAALTAQQGSVPKLQNMVRILAPLVVDPSLPVRHRALGALRNMTVDGGLDVCHEMVLKDVLTPVIALLKQYGENWTPEPSRGKVTDSRVDVFTQAVHVLWNLCEASDVAVSVFNKENLLPVLLPCLQHSVYGYPLATAVAQCLQTVTESNQQAAEVCGRGPVLSSLCQLLCGADNVSARALLYQTALVGILLNVASGDESRSGQIPDLVSILSNTLDKDWRPTLAAYVSRKSQQHSGAESSDSGISGDSISCHRLLDAEEDCSSDRDYQDIVHTVDAQCLSLELLANMCCAPDEEWQDVDSSESGSCDEMADVYNMEQDPATNAQPDDLVDISSKIQDKDILRKVVQLTVPLPGELWGELTSQKWTGALSHKLTRLQTHALLCLNNLVDGLSVEVLGGMDALHQLWETLALQAKQWSHTAQSSSTTSPVPTRAPDQYERLESIVSAMRAVVQKLAQLGSPSFRQVGASDVQFLQELGQGAPSGAQVQVIKILSTMAVLIGRVEPGHPVVQEVGRCLLLAVRHSDLLVVAEAIDSLIDVFSEDPMFPLACSLGLGDAFKSILPQLKEKLQKERGNLGENYGFLKTTRTNLIRFIKYLDSKA